MKKFQIRPVICEMDSAKEFVGEFSIGEKDLVISHRFLYQDYFQSLKLPCKWIFQEDYCPGEPTDTGIDKILSEISGMNVNRVIGVGGGSVLDIAKLLCVKGAKSTEEIFDDKIPLVRDKGLILVPTTCGAGCEMTCVSVVDIRRRNSKIGKRVEANFADYSVLIPQLLEKLPDIPFLYSSVDALIHALEIYLSPNTNDFNDIFCAEAISLILTRYKELSQQGLGKRSAYLADFLRASTYAGVALSNTLCGAVHACAMHFGSAHHVPHGESNYRFLAAVMSKYAELNPQGKIQGTAAIINEALHLQGETKTTFNELQNLLESIIPAKRLRDYGVKQEDLSSYADKVIETQQRLLINNYTPLSRENLISIYESIY